MHSRKKHVVLKLYIFYICAVVEYSFYKLLFNLARRKIKEYQHVYINIQFGINNNEHEFTDAELNFGNVEHNGGSNEHDFDEYEFDIKDIANYFCDFGHNRYDFNVYN